MKHSSLQVYACPSCRSSLSLRVDRESGGEIHEGRLTCCACGSVYPITNGVPRFVASGEYASSFGPQWHWFRTVQLDSATGGTESAETFRATTGWTRADLEGRRVIDAGVGAGRFAEVAASMGGEVFGVDLTEAVDAAYANLSHRPNVHLAQADLFRLPFRDGAFERAYSIGVLHHTPSPPEAFGRVARCVAEGGQLAVYVYARYGPGHHASDLLRRLTVRVPPRLLLAASAAAVPLHYLYRTPGLGRIFALMLPLSPHPHWRWRWLDTFDWYSPKYQSKYLYPEVFAWFRTNGFSDIELFDDPIRMRGTRTSLCSDVSNQLNSVVAS